MTNRRILELIRRDGARGSEFNFQSNEQVPQPIPLNQAYFAFDANGIDQFSINSYQNNWTNEGYGFASASIANSNPFFVGEDSVGKYVSVVSSSAQFSNRLAVTSSTWTIVCVANAETMAARALCDFAAPRFLPIYCNNRWASFDSTSRIWGTNTINEPVSWITTVDSEYNGYNTGSLSVFSPQPYTTTTIDAGSGLARLFSLNIASGFYVGKLYFFALYPWAFSQEEREQMDAYLQARFPTIYGGS